MIIVITPSMRHLYQDKLEQMFELRYEICIKKWGWTVPDSLPGRDIDAFDTADTIYLLYYDEVRDAIIGCCRLNPTTKPYMVSELWPEYCDLQEIPRDPTVWESSRFVISGNLDSKHEYMEIMWRMCVGVCEYCLRVGIDTIAWYTGPAFYQTMNAIMHVEPLGNPHYNAKDDATYIAGVGHIDDEVIGVARSKLTDPSVELTYILSPLDALSTPDRRAA